MRQRRYELTKSIILPMSLGASSLDLKPYRRSRISSAPISASAGEGYSISTLRRRLAAIARTSRRLRPSPRCEASSHSRNVAWDCSQTRTARAAIGGINRRGNKKTMRHMRWQPDRRARPNLLVCFAGALRRSELIGLDVQHVKETAEGVTLLIPRSKTDKKGEGQAVSLVYGQSKETCPVSALQAWLTLASIRSGPIFRKINRGGNVQSRRLCASAIRQLLLKRAKMAGLTGSLLEPRKTRMACGRAL